MVTIAERPERLVRRFGDFDLEGLQLFEERRREREQLRDVLISIGNSRWPASSINSGCRPDCAATVRNAVARVRSTVATLAV